MIKRSDRKKPFVMVDYSLSRDDRLSFESRGFLIYLLTMDDDFKFNVRGLATMTGLSMGAISRIIKELQSFGYIEIVEKRSKGKFHSCSWIVRESPCSKKPNTVTPNTAQPNTVTPNTATLNDKDITIKSYNNTKLEQSKNINKAKPFSEILDRLPDDLKDVFEEFIKMRKAIKAPLTDRALDLAVKKAFELGNNDPEKVKAIVEQSIANSWRGIFPLKEESKAKTEPLKPKFDIGDYYRKYGITGGNK